MALFNFGKKDGLKKFLCVPVSVGLPVPKPGKVQRLTQDVVVVHQRYSR